MEEKSIPVLLITANVGSLFEDPEAMLSAWVAELLSVLSKFESKFVALHCQEIGGKQYAQNMKYVKDFIQMLMRSDQFSCFDKARIFVDEDFSLPQNFTSLASFYFVHESVTSVSMWDFDACAFVPIVGREIQTGNIEQVPTKEKAKFPKHFFPEGKWSRKGYMRTRWSIDGSIFDLINLHLFHDASNLVALESAPSVYSRNRERALQYILKRFSSDRYDTAPCFLFGDFNFRTNTNGVIEKLAEDLTTVRLQNNKNNDSTKLQFVNDNNDSVLTIGKKQFKFSEQQHWDWLKMFDNEVAAFKDALTEFPVTFHPSYPFEEDTVKPKAYMKTRCPAWCDRILLGHSAKELVEENFNVEYGVIGADTCMGDHKPVYVQLAIKKSAGLITNEFENIPPGWPVEDFGTLKSTWRYVTFKNEEDLPIVCQETSL